MTNNLSRGHIICRSTQVDDEATSVLMARFYRKMLVDGLKPSAALRAAQLDMLKAEEWRNPYYWAAFTMQGEWR